MKVVQTGLNFGQAIEALKDGKLVSRAGWNGKDMFLLMNGDYSVPRAQCRPDNAINSAFLEAQGCEELVIQPHIDMWTAQKTLCVGWLASQMDVNATDWCIVEIEN